MTKPIFFKDLNRNQKDKLKKYMQELTTLNEKEIEVTKTLAQKLRIRNQWLEEILKSRRPLQHLNMMIKKDVEKHAKVV